MELLRITEFTVPDIVIRNYDVKLICKAEYSSPFTFEFYRKIGNKQYLLSNSGKYSIDGGELLIKNLSFSDNGDYVCQVKADDLGDSKTVNIVVKKLTIGKALFIKIMLCVCSSSKLEC